jgi:hypothetical protein
MKATISYRNYFAQRTLFIESSEFRRIEESLGAATAHMAVTNPVVIKTTKTQPGTSPCSSASARCIRILTIFKKLLSLATTFTFLRELMLPETLR